MLEHYSIFTIRLFSVISRPLLGAGFLPLCRISVTVHSFTRQGNRCKQVSSVLFKIRYLQTIYLKIISRIWDKIRIKVWYAIKESNLTLFIYDCHSISRFFRKLVCFPKCKLYIIWNSPTAKIILILQSMLMRLFKIVSTLELCCV